jgi:hypothetical protein
MAAVSKSRRVLEGSGRNLRAVLGERSAPLRESPLQITLMQCLAASDKMDWIVQKAVELGVARVQPVASRRAVVKLSGDRAQRRVEHWQQIAVAACEQCGRNRVPDVLPLQTFRSGARAGRRTAPACCIRRAARPEGCRPAGRGTDQSADRTGRRLRCGRTGGRARCRFRCRDCGAARAANRDCGRCRGRGAQCADGRFLMFDALPVA